MQKSALAALLLLSSAAVAAEHKVTGHGINEGNPFCRPLMLHLAGASPEMLPLLQMPETETATITRPKWTDLNNAGIAARVYGRVGPKGAKLQTARFDLDNDGTAEDVYRLTVEVRSNFPDSRSLVKFEAGATGWLFDVAEKSDTELAKEWPRLGNNPIDVFFYNGKTRIMMWDWEGEGKRKLSVATLAKDASAADSGHTEFLKFECGLNEFMR